VEEAGARSGARGQYFVRWERGRSRVPGPEVEKGGEGGGIEHCKAVSQGGGIEHCKAVSREVPGRAAGHLLPNIS